MFKIIRNGRRFNKMSFDSYEKARSYVRKWLRKNMQMSIKDLKTRYSNPAITAFGFKITTI